MNFFNNGIKNSSSPFLIKEPESFDLTLSFKPTNYVIDAIDNDSNNQMIAPVGTSMNEISNIINKYRDEICPPDPVFEQPKEFVSVNLLPVSKLPDLSFHKYPGDSNYRAINNPLCSGTGPAKPDPLPPMTPGMKAEYEMMNNPPLRGMIVNHPCMGPFAMK